MHSRAGNIDTPFSYSGVGSVKSAIRQWNKRRLHNRKNAAIAAGIAKTTAEQFGSAGLPVPAFRILASDTIVGATDMIIRKENGQITVLFNGMTSKRHLFGHTRNKIAAYLHWFGQTSADIREILVDASDGNTPSTARYKYATTSDAATPLPDPHFFRDYGYRATDHFAANQAPAWDDRQDQIIWRGRLNNDGLFSLDPALIDNPGVMQRLRMALKCKQSDVDFRFVSDSSVGVYDRILADAGLIGGFVPTHDWGGMKYAIDIDGYTNAWCNFMQRLKLGCCVLKVASPFGYYQWYYHKLTAWEHFVPVRADLSDLAEKVDWVRTHQKEARDIAARGQAFARSLTFESENQVAVNAIEDREKA